MVYSGGYVSGVNVKLCGFSGGGEGRVIDYPPPPQMIGLTRDKKNNI